MASILAQVKKITFMLLDNRTKLGALSENIRMYIYRTEKKNGAETNFWSQPQS
jgi:hypothetical protein